MPDLHKNFAYSTVLTPPSPATSGTTVTVQSGDGSRFPTPPFNVTIWPASSIPIPTTAEIARCTGISGDVLTITRAQEGTSARSVIAGDQIAATITAKTVTDVEGPPTCRVYNSGAISINNNTPTALTFDSERYDVYGMHDTVTNSSRITVPTGWGGVYVITGNVGYAAVNTTGERDFAIRLNNTSDIASMTMLPSSSIVLNATISTQYKLAAGDYVELRAFQTSGGALNVAANAQYSPEFMVAFIGTS